MVKYTLSFLIICVSYISQSQIRPSNWSSSFGASSYGAINGISFGGQLGFQFGESLFQISPKVNATIMNTQDDEIPDLVLRSNGVNFDIILGAEFSLGPALITPYLGPSVRYSHDVSRYVTYYSLSKEVVRYESMDTKGIAIGYTGGIELLGEVKQFCIGLRIQHNDYPSKNAFTSLEVVLRKSIGRQG